MGNLFWFCHRSSGNTLFFWRIQSSDPFLLYLTGWPYLFVRHDPEVISTEASMSFSRFCLAFLTCPICPPALHVGSLHGGQPHHRPGRSCCPCKPGPGSQSASSLREHIPCSFLSQFRKDSLSYFCLPQAHSLTLIFLGEMTFCFTSPRWEGVNVSLCSLPHKCFNLSLPSTFLPSGPWLFWDLVPSVIYFSPLGIQNFFFLFMGSILACSNLIPQIPFPQFWYPSSYYLLPFISIICYINPK